MLLNLRLQHFYDFDATVEETLPRIEIERDDDDSDGDDDGFSTMLAVIMLSLLL